MGIDFLIKMFNETIGGILFIAILLILVNFIEKRDFHKLERKRLKFHEKLKDALKNKRINDISHIKKLYASIVNTNYFHLQKWSKEVLFDLNTENNEIFEKLDEIIKKIEFEEPFSGLPDEEKEVLSTLLNDKSTNRELFENKLHRLSDIMKAKYAKKEKSDKLIFRLGVASFVLAMYGAIKSF
jgi:hypothetical protein